MSGGKFHRGGLIVAAIVACGAGLMSGPGLWPGPASANATGLAGCTAAALRLTVRGLGAAGGSGYYSIDLTNMSGRTCTLAGYPRVSFVSAPDGRQVGATAGHDPVYADRLVILRPGREAHARLRVGASRDYPEPACHPVSVRWMRVYMPAAAAPLYADFAGTACAAAAARVLSISRIQPGWAGAGAGAGGEHESAGGIHPLSRILIARCPGNLIRISASSLWIPPVNSHQTVPVGQRLGPLVLRSGPLSPAQRDRWTPSGWPDQRQPDGGRRSEGIEQ